MSDLNVILVILGSVVLIFPVMNILVTIAANITARNKRVKEYNKVSNKLNNKKQTES